MVRLLSLCIFLLCAGPVRGADERFVTVEKGYVALYSGPSDSFPPVQIARSGRIFKVYCSTADDSGAIWFCLAVGPGKRDTVWAHADNLRYCPVSADSGKTGPHMGTEDHKDKLRRYAVIRNNPDWSRRIKNAVRNGEIVLHMTREQLLGSWGEPQRTTSAFMVGVGNYQIYYYEIKGKKNIISVALLRDLVLGWSEE